MAYPSGLGWKDSAIGGEMPAVFGGDACQLEETSADGRVLPLYSITQV